MEIESYLPKDLYKGQSVFVTGGGSGINLGVAKIFARLGADVAICGRTQEKLESAAEEIREFGGKALPIVADVRSLKALDDAMARTNAEMSPLNTIVAGAAGNFMVRAEELSENGFKTVIDIDLNGSFNASRAAFKYLKPTRGNIMFISAPQAFVPTAFQVHAASAKAGIEIMMRNLALEWGKHGIRANTIVPGLIEGTVGLSRTNDEESMSHQKVAIPLGRFGLTQDIGHAAAFLASPLAEFITGTTLIVDGGLCTTGRILMDHGFEGEFPSSSSRK